MRAQELLPDLIRAARRGPEDVLAALDEPLRDAGLAPRRTKGAPSAVLWTRGAPSIALSGHVDTVPAGEGWTKDPHGGALEDGRVWGRGACDMLGPVACFVEAAASARSSPCAILLTTDEETTMRAAQVALDEGLLAGIGGVVVGEPTSLTVGIAEKGVLWVRATARGRNAHGSMPHLGDNAAERLVRGIQAVLREPLPDDVHRLLGRATRNLGRLEAGEAVNQVPASARAELDLRYLPGQSRDVLLASMEEAARAAGEPLAWEMISDHVPFETREDAPVVRAARAAVAATRGEALVVGLPYGTEASKYAPAGLDVVILGPGDAALAHTSRESIALDDLGAGAAIYARILDAQAGRRA